MAELETQLATTENTSQPEPPPKKVNPLIARAKLPGETFAIPSGGFFYEHDELTNDVENGELHVHPMAAYDEILIKTPTLLLNGKAIEEVFKRCIPQVNKPMDLLAKDVDFLLVALRQVTYGKLMDVVFTHDCENGKEHGYRVDIGKFTQNAKKINPTTIGKNYTLKLKGDGVEQKVELRPARYKEMIDMLQLFALSQEHEDNTDVDMNLVIDETKGLLKSALSVIKSVDGIEDDELIYEWLESIPASWVEKITSSVEKTADWGPNFNSKDKCKDCNKVITISVPINPISFFTSR